MAYLPANGTGGLLYAEHRPLFRNRSQPFPVVQPAKDAQIAKLQTKPTQASSPSPKFRSRSAYTGASSCAKLALLAPNNTPASNNEGADARLTFLPAVLVALQHTLQLILSHCSLNPQRSGTSFPQSARVSVTLVIFTRRYEPITIETCPLALGRRTRELFCTSPVERSPPCDKLPGCHHHEVSNHRRSRYTS